MNSPPTPPVDHQILLATPPTHCDRLELLGTSHLPLKAGDAIGQPRKSQKSSPQQNSASGGNTISLEISLQQSLYRCSSSSSCLENERPSKRRPGKRSSVSKPGFDSPSTQDRCFEQAEVTKDAGPVLGPKRYVYATKAASPDQPALNDAFLASPVMRRSVIPVRRQASRLRSSTRSISKAYTLETKSRLPIRSQD